MRCSDVVAPCRWCGCDVVLCEEGWLALDLSVECEHSPTGRHKGATT